MKLFFNLLIACAAIAGAIGCGLELEDGVIGQGTDPATGASACEKLLTNLGTACKADPAKIQEAVKSCTPEMEALAKCHLGCLPGNTCPDKEQLQACDQKCLSRGTPTGPQGGGFGEPGGYGEEGYGEEGYGDDFAGE
jgi:hypothetical protein